MSLNMSLNMSLSMSVVHGGADAQGVPLHDFSTNSNACGPCPLTMQALRETDATHYPDPHYTQLRAQLGSFHDVSAERIVVAASSSEFIHRVTAYAARAGLRQIATDAKSDVKAALHWACEPASPLGGVDDSLEIWRAVSGQGEGALRILDCAYQPLRLDHQRSVIPDAVWQMWTPNKSLGLTGVRAAYAIAPQSVGAAQIEALQALAPSWPVGAHGVAMLASWVDPQVQQWLQECLPVLRRWKIAQMELCAALGWSIVPGSIANYFVARLPEGINAQPLLHSLRAAGVKLRDCTSFGLPGHVRVGVRSPESQQALAEQWRRCVAQHGVLDTQ